MYHALIQQGCTKDEAYKKVGIERARLLHGKKGVRMSCRAEKREKILHQIAKNEERTENLQTKLKRLLF